MKEWMTVKEFEKWYANAGAIDVIIRYKGGENKACYRNGRYLFNAESSECYMSECITGVKLVLR